MRCRLALFALLLVPALAGCDSNQEDAPTLQGRFEGTFAYTVLDEMFEEFWEMTLAQNTRGDVTGNGLLGVDVVTVRGTHDHPDVTLSFFDRDDVLVGIFTGELSNDGAVLEGVFNFSIFFVDVPVTLRRQEVRLLLRRRQ